MEPPPHPRSADDLIQKARQLADALNARDPEAFARLFSEDVVFVDNTSPDPLHGRAAARWEAEMMTTAFPDARREILNILVQDDMTAMEVLSEGTHTGPLALPTGDELPPSGNRVRWQTAIFSRYGDDGLITEQHRYLDSAGFMLQLGIGGAGEAAG